MSTIREILGVELKCDDLQMLPDAGNLMPLAQLLIHYPKLRRKRTGRCLVPWLWESCWQTPARNSGRDEFQWLETRIRTRHRWSARW